MGLIVRKSTNEDSLIAGCRKGKSSSQKLLFEKYSPKMLGVIMRYVKDKMEAEEIMIAGFMKIYNKIDQFRGDGNFEGWIRRIMVNEALLYLRKYKNMSIEVDLDYANSKTEHDIASDHLQVEDLMRLIQELPVGYRTVFNMYAIEGYSHKEIGELLQINENTSKSQLSRARKFLQSRIIELEKEELGNGKVASYEN